MGPGERGRAKTTAPKRSGAFALVVTDEDYRCVWRPCEAFDKDLEDDEAHEERAGEASPAPDDPAPTPPASAR